MNHLDLNEYYYYDDEIFEYLDDDNIFDDSYPSYTESHNLKAQIESCSLPSVYQVSNYLCIILLSCAVCRLLWLGIQRFLGKAELVQHFVSVICGLIALIACVGNGVIMIMLLTLSYYGVLLVVAHLQSKMMLRTNKMGITVGMIAISANIVFELVSNNEMFNSIRGIQMVITMKAISIAFDGEEENKEKSKSTSIPFLLPYLGYVMCPASCLHGPWMPYRAYVFSMRKPSNGLVQGIVWTMTNSCLALISLNVSNCLAPLICTQHSFKWLQAFRDALTVRTSHYFISFTSQATLAAAGISWNPDAPQNKYLGNVITNPYAIEVPRSLSSLARNWNLPMHSWLKTYVFKKSQSHLHNYFAAVFVTYLTSSLLHGLYYQVHVVLLSLGCFAYVENVLRKKLADIFDACIAATPCREPCSYRNCNKNSDIKQFTWWIPLINTAFKILSVFHLAYLGVILGANENGTISFMDSFLRWRQLDYLNHYIVAALFAIYCLV